MRRARSSAVAGPFMNTLQIHPFDECPMRVSSKSV
jgi:hypothetical protein